MDIKLALTVNQHGFRIMAIDEYGSSRIVAASLSLECVLREAVAVLGYEIIFPVSGPTTQG